MKLLSCITLLLFCLPAQAQTTGLSLIKKISNSVFPPKDSILLQTIQGSVFEKDNHQPLAGATIALQREETSYIGAITDANGNFDLKKISVGRHTLRVSYLGFKEVLLTVMVEASRGSVVEVPMEVSPLYLTELKIHSLDDLAPLGANLIDTDDLNRHAGNRGEAIRKVAVLPGIQSADDSRNDIIIRGNSPQSVLWRIEGVNVPNPNHFNIPGTSGGPVSIINDRMLASSSFYSGAFPAEFGNTTSGIFDLRFRNGDTTAHHTTAQLGLLGLEYSGQGPLSTKGKSSYIFSVRHSTLGFFDALNIDLGTESIPRYTDASFKINFPSGKGSSFSLFGLGGISKVDILISQQDDVSQNLYGEKDRDQYFKSSSGVVGLSYKKKIRTSAFLATTVAVSAERIVSHHDFVNPPDIREAILRYDSFPDGIMYPGILDYKFKETRISASSNYTKRLNRSHQLEAGVGIDHYIFSFLDSSRNINMDIDDSLFGTWRIRWQSMTNSTLIQPYAQWKYTANKFDIITGLHHQFFSLNKSRSIIEPRISVQYYLNEKTKLNAGFGLHSQIQQPYLYFYGSENDSNKKPIPQNINMGFTRSRHLVAGVEKYFGSDSSGIRIKLEAYYQSLYDVPVDEKITSFSLINTGADFTRLTPDKLKNEGRAKNYGLELTAERAFSSGYLFLFTGSLFESKYEGSDRVWRNSDFNCKYISNLLFTREWRLKKQNIIALGSKFIAAGGRWYGPVDTVASIAEKNVVFFSEEKNTRQFKPYFRLDLRISYKLNLPSISHELALDLINVFNRANVLKLTYIPGANQNEGSVTEEYQLGTLPFFYYRVSL